MKALKSTFILTLVLILLAMPLTSCTDSSLKSTEDDLRTVMTIAGYDVPYEQFRYFLMNYKAQIDGGNESVWLGDDAEEYIKKLDGYVVDALRGLYAVLDICKDYGINITDKDIQAAVDMTVEDTIISYDGKNKGHKKYAAGLAANYMNDAVYRFIVGVDLCEAALYTKLIELGEIDDSDEAALANINGEDFIRTIQILVKNDPKDDIEENRKAAEDLLARIKNGEDFDSLIVKYSEDLSMTPDGYYSTRLELIEEYEKAAYELEIGEVSEVVESHVGFHIIKRLEKEADYIEKNFASLKTQYLTSAFYRMIEKEKALLDVEKTELYISFTVENME